MIVIPLTYSHSALSQFLIFDFFKSPVICRKLICNTKFVKKVLVCVIGNGSEISNFYYNVP